MNYIYFENGLLFDFAQSDNVPIETNTCYWNKFQILKIYRSYGTSFQNLHFFYKPFASTKQKHLLNSNIWNKFQTSNYLSFLWNFLSNFYFFCKPFASTKQKHLLNSNVWNKFQTSNYLSFLRNFLSKSTFFLQTFCFYEAKTSFKL